MKLRIHLLYRTLAGISSLLQMNDELMDG